MTAYTTMQVDEAQALALAGGQAPESWRPTVGIPPCRDGAYRVSSLGRIRRAVGGHGSTVGRFLKTDGKLWVGYHSVNLRSGGVGRRIHVHIVVALAFHGPRPTPLHEVNHKDGNKLNNRADNLEWATKSQNMTHAYALGLKAPVSLKGSNNPAAKLSPEAVAQIRADGRSVSQRKQAARYGVSKTAIALALGGETW